MALLNELAKKKEGLVNGHRLCPGCTHSVIMRQVMAAADTDKYDIVAAAATGCFEVSTGLYPYTSWNISWIHNAFENAASTISGVEAMYKVWKKKGKTDKDIRFMALASDGGTYDIGLQALSGAIERGHQFLYICNDNNAYQNTGNQRSSATPFGASTTTSPNGTVIPGKQQPKKDIMSVLEGHHMHYIAQASPSNWRDLMDKVKKALDVNGPTYINVIEPCTTGWGFPQNKSIEIAQLAVDTCVWPLYEVVEGKVVINYKPKNKLPVEDYLKPQKRFAHLFKKGNEHLIEEYQKQVDKHWEWLLKREESGIGY
jgi:pyruvate ferredoxin oxidoreductase beta subunit